MIAGHHVTVFDLTSPLLHHLRDSCQNVANFSVVMVQTHVCILQTTLDMIDQVDETRHQSTVRFAAISHHTCTMPALRLCTCYGIIEKLQTCLP